MFSSNTSAVSVDTLYVEDVFSTYLYTGNGSTQTITNGIDLAGKGGLVWFKNRTSAADNALFNMPAVVDSYNTIGYQSSNSTSGSITTSPLTIVSTSFSTLGFGLNGSSTVVNNSGQNYASWAFRKAPKFFDVVTYTGNGGAQSIAHSLGQVPGMIITKATSTTGDWLVTLPSWGVTASFLKLNATNARTMLGAFADNTGMTSTAFNVSSSNSVNGVTYVAYLFGHDASSDGLIQCGTFTTDGSGNATVTSLGWEPQFLMVKATSTTGDWIMLDIMRGWNMTATDARLLANSTAAETTYAETGNPTATGFRFQGGSASATYIYMAIRRGPMRTPTDATKVFSPLAYTAPTGAAQTTGFPVDWQLKVTSPNGAGSARYFFDRLRGTSTNPNLSAGALLRADTADGESSLNGMVLNWNSSGFETPSSDGSTYTITWNFRRAAGFFDIVCYTGTGAARTVSHNLGAVPKMMLVKSRTSNATSMVMYTEPTGPSTYAIFTQTFGFTDVNNTYWGGVSPTNSQFTVGTSSYVNQSGSEYVAYLFGNVPGVSKIGTYTGNGTTLSVDCGFAGGARFVMIKCTNSNGQIWVVDTARGIVEAADPILALGNSTAQTTILDNIDPSATGFAVVQNGTTNINVSGNTYVYLAIA